MSLSMIPSYEAFFAPTLRALEQGSQPLEALARQVADALSLDQGQRLEVVVYDGEPVYLARTRMALKELVGAELVVTEGNVKTLTARGQERLSKDLVPRSIAELEDEPAYVEYRSRQLARRGA